MSIGSLGDMNDTFGLDSVDETWENGFDLVELLSRHHLALEKWLESVSERNDYKNPYQFVKGELFAKKLQNHRVGFDDIHEETVESVSFQLKERGQLSCKALIQY